MRFTEAPFANPFKTAQAPAARDPATTGSINRAPAMASDGSYVAPANASVRSQPLPPPQSAVALRAAPAAPVAGSANGWSAQGGTPIVVAQGETLDMISSRYGVPRAALMSANGLSGSEIAPGSRITIPVYNANASAAPAPVRTAQSQPVQSDMRPEPARRAVAAPAPQPAQIASPRPTAPAADATTRAKAAAQLKAQSTAEAKAQAAAEAKAKAVADAAAMREARAKFAAEAKAKSEAKKAVPVAAKPAAAAAPVVAEVKKPVAQPKAAPVVVANAPAAPVTPVAKAVPAPVEEPKTTASLPKAQEEASEKADFRWPARGRVIAGFSGKGGNEGINIAVPEGTPVKAAEGGTVAYAGSELKGYGNLVLIRHPNGYVSAYAHNGELKVKRGDAVKRGQVVASSGQSGNVSSPQLHFELRKGAAPVDPTPYLNN
ncbi:MAG: peptidoglycan DD-metalloendopeptidase family protein [Bosea sp. (in: a-proteobacteria)]